VDINNIPQKGKIMKTKITQVILGLAVTCLGAAAFAYIPEGHWTDGWEYYYVNYKYEYCSTDYSGEARRLNPQQQQELRSYSYQGACEGYDKGPKNYQGRSYYFNGEGAYCQYRYYKSNLQEMRSSEAQHLFQSNRFDGTCVE
jgi:hypothetical protein